MSNSMHFALYPLPATDDQINERLREMSDKFNRGSNCCQNVFNPIKTVPVVDCIVSQSHIALLLEDGRICRVAYSVHSDRLDLSTTDTSKTNNVKGSLVSTVNSLGAPRLTARRGRVLRTSTTARGRGSSSVIMGNRPVVPAQYVPEDLVSQAQVVLQGKSRNLIIRELQRTNLDVNLAVNNLLSRDDEEAEDMDESQDSYLPSDDLMSLLDAGIHNDHPSVIIDADAVFPEDVFSYSSVRVRSSSNRLGRTTSSDRERDSSAPEREHMIRFGNERQYVSGSASSGPSSSRRWLEYALRDSASASDGNKSPGNANTVDGTSSNSRKRHDASQLNPFYISDQLEYWPSSDKKFTQIIGLYSELVAITNTGQLCQWKWSEPEPYKCQISDGLVLYHPKTLHLGLLNEKISQISGQCIRASVLTENMKIATWIDESLSSVCSKLEHTAQSFIELQHGEKISSIHVCSLYTCVRLESGNVYWWGVAPFSHRKKMWEKLQARAKKLRSTNPTGSEIVTGAQVCLKNSPFYSSGAIGFTTAGGVPKVGMLVTAAWNISDTCVFKVLGTQELRKLGVTIPVLPSSNSKMDPSKEQPPSPSFSKPSQERLEMPPPPSPASSTCSEPGASPLPKRSKRITNTSTVKDEDKKDEESWNLKDVVFIEDNKSNPIGRVIKIDGAYAAVRFPNKDMCDPSDVNTVLQECRLLRRDELQLIKGSSQRVPDCFQKQPKKVNIPDSSQIIKMTVSNQGIHAIIRNNNKLNYVVYSVTSGKVEQDCTFPTDPTSFLGQDQSLISLYCHGENENITLLRDGNGALYPLAKNCIDSIKDPITLDMAPTQSIGIGISPVKDCAPNQKNQIAVIVLALENQMLIPAILRSDPEYVRLTLASLEKESVNQQVMASERIDGNRNILHTAVSACFPTSNKCNIESSNEEPTTDALDLLNTNSSRNVSLHDVMVRTKSSAIRSPGSSVERENRDSNTEGSDSEMGSSPATGMPLLSWPSDPPVPNEMPFYDQNDQKSAALSVLWILTESQALKPFMKELMSAKDAQGCTPFMLAVSGRAYSAALHLFAVAQRIAKEMSSDLETQKKILMSMIYPRGSNPDDSPLHVICCNDTCSFTWTGAEHINQDIFECKTCGLTGSLCCCTECARVCHKGHDCKLKRTSPTAYCDCWEKCKCKALIAGNQTARHQLFKKLLSETDLVTLPNSRRENILLFLVQTVGRQIIEQRQYRPLRPRSTLTRKTPDLVGNADTDMPDHDLKPPRFASRALDKVLDDWNAVKSMILSGYRGDNANIGNLTYNSCKNSLSYAAAEEQAFLTSQNGTALLDKFTHCLLVKVGVEMLDTLLGTIVRELQKRNSSNAKEAKIVARRFVRSVARIGVVLCVELTPSSYLNINNSATVWKQSQTSSQLQKCKRVFQCLLPFAIEELCEIADALIAPVRLGVARPTAPFQLVSSILDAVHGSEELLSVDPILSQNGLQASSINETASEPAILSSVNEERRNDVQNASSLVNSAVGADVVVGGVDDDVVDVVEGPEDGDHDASDHEHDDVAEAQENAHEESDSDSDSNLDDASYQSNVDNASAQRSATTGATAGSDAGVASLAYFSEDESADSSNAEDEEESEAAETEPDTEELAFIEDPIDRRANNVVGSTSNVSVSNPNTNSTPQGVRSNLAQHLQWALRHRELNSSTTSATATSTTGSRITPGSISGSTGLIHIDPTPGGRRTTQTTVAPLPSTSTSNETVSMATTAVSLARAFSIVIRQIASLLPTLHSLGDKNSLSPLNCVAFTHSESVSLLNYLENRLRPTWDWLITVMDSTEGQLRFGCALTNTSSTTAGSMSTFSSHVQHVPRQGTVRRSEDRLSQTAEVRSGGSSRRSAAPTSRFSTSASMDGNYARRDFLSYAMSLMRSHNNEHLDSLPVLDVASLKHVAYVFDSLIYYMRSGNEGISPNIKIAETHREDWQPAESENEADEADEDIPPYNSASTDMAIDEDSIPNVSIGSSLAKERKHPFFQRSSSTLFLGCPPPDPFATPLAEALPLADQPHLLQPTARREDLFSVPRPPVSNNSDCDQEVLEALPARISLSERYDNMCSRKVDEQPSASLNSSALLDLSAAESQYSFAGNSRAQSVIAETSQNRSPIIVSGPSLSTSNKSSVIVHAASIKASNSAFSSNKSNAQDGERNSAQKSDYLVINKKPLSLIGNMVQHDILLGRWRLALELFGRVFVDDVGIEPGSIISELGGFPVKEAKFRRDMERRRNSQQRDITFTKMERERNSLIQQTFKELNAMYNNFSRRLSVGVPMLAVARVKVTFKDEPGEGSGVARSFYTAFAEAILSAEKLPPLDCCQAGGNRSLQYNLIQRLKSKEREREQQRRAYQSHRSQSRDSASNSRPDLNERDSQSQLRYDAPPFVMPGEQQPHAQQNNGSVNLNELLSPHRQQLGVRLYSRVAQLRPSLAAKVTGMLLELSPSQLLNLFSSEEALRNKVDEAVDIVLSHGREANTNNPENLLELDVFNSRSNNGSNNGKSQGVQRTGEMEEEEDVEDNAPLFYQPGKRGFYSPRQGRCTPERLNAFRNVGRILGLCLLQNELCPIFLNRHVIKYILRRPIAWHDLAFFDPMLYESLRMLIVDAENSRDSSMLAGLDLRFSVDLCPEEGGCQVDLIPNGRNVEVTLQNIYDYVRRYASYRMVKSQERALQYLRQGIFDVLPNNALDGLTAEDFRLLLNGVGEINVQQLISYTTFNDESGDGSDHLTYFKRWLWSIIEKMSIQEKQDLVYFWTGSPALPASEEGFQPMPSITIRPADDQHLPTANTCISRLYIPLYSSKATLRSKLLMAIKTKNFGFV